MHIDQARVVRQCLVCLEGIVSPETREYVWKVLIAPACKEQIERFAVDMDPSRPFYPEAALKRYPSSDLSVYFFLKKEGKILYREYTDFLFLNRLRIKLPAFFVSSSITEHEKSGQNVLADQSFL